MRTASTRGLVGITILLLCIASVEAWRLHVSPNGDRLANRKSGDNFLVVCSVLDYDGPASAVKIEWFKGSNEIKFGRVMTIGKPNASQLMIIKARKDDSGAYVCKAEINGESQEATADISFIRAPEFVDAKVEQHPEDGTTAEIICRVEGEPQLEIFWQFNGNTLDETSPRGYEFKENNQILIIPNYDSKKDDGHYLCNAAQFSSFETQAINVSGYSRPKITVFDGPENNRGFEGHSVQFQCGAIGKPKPVYKWFKVESNEEIVKSDVHAVDDGLLVIHSLSSGDVGEYRCEATNDIGADERIATLSVFLRPRVERLVNNTKQENESVDIVCKYSGEGKVKAKFVFGDNVYKVHSESDEEEEVEGTEASNEKTDDLKNDGEQDNGENKSENAENDDAEDDGDKEEVAVNDAQNDASKEQPADDDNDDGEKAEDKSDNDDKDEETAAEDENSEASRERAADENDRNDSEQAPEHDAAREIDLNDDDGDDDENGNNEAQDEENEDIHDKEENLQSGEHNAPHPIAEDEHHHHGHNHHEDDDEGHPVVEELDEDVDVADEQDDDVSGGDTSIAAAEQRRRFKREMTNNRVTVREEDNQLVLTIGELSHDDAGLYKCVVENEAGAVTRTSHLAITHAPVMKRWTEKTVRSFDGNEVELFCEVKAVPEPNWVWEQNGQEVEADGAAVRIDTEGTRTTLSLRTSSGRYGEYKCIASNGVGVPAEKVIEVVEVYAPPSPTHLNCQEHVYPNYATCSLSEEQYGEEKIRPTEVEFAYAPSEDVDGDFNWERDSVRLRAAYDERMRISDLKPNSAYLIRARAINEAGESELGVQATIETTDPWAPERPESVSIECDERCTVTWNEPNNHGASLTGYKVAIREYTQNKESDEREYGSQLEISVSGGDAAVELTQLQPSTHYEVSVSALNSVGESEARVTSFETPSTLTPYSAGGLSSTQLIIIVVGVLCLVCTIVDLICFATNRCGVLACICLNCCGRSHDRKNKDLEAGRPESNRLLAESSSLRAPLILQSPVVTSV